MRKINYILATVLTLFVLHSCSYTDLQPTDMVGPDEAFKDVASVHKAVIGAYGKMSLRDKLAIAEYIADDVMQGGDAGGTGTDLASWVYAASSGDASSFWGNAYSLINQCNRILYFGPEAAVQDEAEKEQLNNELGTAYFFRAYAHFELLCFFSDFGNDDKLGIPYVSHYHILGQPARDKVGECYEQLMLDLDRAYNMITEEIPSDNAYVSKVAVNALRARISLYHKKYTHALVYASDVLRKVEMAERNEVAEVWTDKSEAGIIFKLPRTSGQANIGGCFVGGDNSSVFKPTSEYMNSYVSGDIRSDVFYGKGPDRSGNQVDVVMKWYGGGSNIGLCDEKLLRAEEMKLIKAEAEARLDKMTDANTTLNELRSVRITGWVAQTYDQNTMLEEILKERRRELAFEGHRLFDLRRFGKNIERNGKVLEANNYHMILPIPTAELDANENINQEDQNPGY